MMTQIKIECFLTLARTLSFTETAKELYITQQSVSNNILSMEKDLGFPLFVRTSRMVKLTEEGQRCAELFRQMFMMYHDTIDELRRARRPSGVMHIGYQEWLDFGPEPYRTMTALQAEQPDFRLSGERFPPSILRDRIINGQLDIALMYKSFFQSLSVTDKDLCSLDLLDSSRAIVVATGHPKAVPGATYKDFIHEPFLFDVWGNEATAESNKRAEATIALWGLEPSKIVIVPNRDSGYTSAELGEGVIASSELNRIADRSTLKKYAVDGSYETVVCIWRKSNPNPMVEKYAVQLQKEYRHRRKKQRAKAVKETKGGPKKDAEASGSELEK